VTSALLDNFRSRTDLISLFATHLAVVVGDDRSSSTWSKSPRLRRFKSDRDEIWHDCSNVPKVNTHRLMASRRRIFDLTSHFWDGAHDVISLRQVLVLSRGK